MMEEYNKNVNFSLNVLYSDVKVFVMDIMWYKLKIFVIYDKRIYEFNFW